jgi:NADH:ubiquinone oxidoreductase subunit E
LGAIKPIEYIAVRQAALKLRLSEVTKVATSNEDHNVTKPGDADVAACTAVAT